MGLFGLFYAAFCGGAKIVDEVDKSIKDAQGRSQSTNGITYNDGRGNMRSIETGHTVSYNDNVWHDGSEKEGRHHQIIDDKTKVVVRDLTLEKLEKENNKRRLNGCTTIIVSFDNHKNDKIQGIRYKDITTGEIYVRRNYSKLSSFMNKDNIKLKLPLIKSYGEYYMDMNGKLIRKTDECIQNMQNGIEYNDEIFDIVNENKKGNWEYSNEYAVDIY